MLHCWFQKLQVLKEQLKLRCRFRVGIIRIIYVYKASAENADAGAY